MILIGVAVLAALYVRVISITGDPQPSVAPPHIKGWHLMFADNFEGSSLNTRSWGAYSGRPAGDPGAWWDPSHVVVRDGVARLETYRDPRFGNRWVSGGMSSAYALKQKYGKYLVRLRMDRGVGIEMIALLWPSADIWPPEIDFTENGGGNRQHNTATLHYNGPDGDRRIQRRKIVDLTHWHVLGVEWSPSQLKYTLDGAVWTTVRSPHVPNIAMELDAQAQAAACGDPTTRCPNKTTPRRVDFDIDWVAAYQRS